jgi:tetratricopeptide (TPR) repeat protein
MTKTRGYHEQKDEIKISYNLGLQNYNQGNLHQAESEFVKVLKPLLSRPLMRTLDTDFIKVFKVELLDSMYHLGQIYLRGDYSDHHSKAAAIFQYCAGFSIKHKASIEIDGKKYTEVEDNYTYNAEYFLNLAYLVERQFLAELEINDGSTEQEYCSNYQQKITEYKEELAAIRNVIKNNLSDISDLKIENIAQRAEAVKNIYYTSTKFFVNQETKLGFIQKLLTNCYKQLGNPPKECEYTVIGLGSLSNGTMTPWSDLEFAILINENGDEYREYFRNLTKLLHIKIINLGETPLRTVGIESLNNFSTAQVGDDWFWDDIINSGFSFDGSDWHACKQPLGRQGYRVANKVTNDNGIEETVIIDKPDYELILTPQQMSELQLEQREEGVERPSFASDKHLLQALKSVCLIDGNQTLLDEYRIQLQTVEKLEVLRNRDLKILQEDVNKFHFKLGEENEGKLMDVKKDIYRLGDRIVNALANYYGISAKSGQPAITAWQMIDTMKKNGIISPGGAENLKNATSISTELRLKTYCNSTSQSETISTYVPAVEHLTPEARQHLLTKIFYLEANDILYYLYYVMLPVQQVVKGLCNNELRDKAEIFLSKDNLYNDSNHNKGMVHARFLNYKKSLEFLETAQQEQPNNLVILDNLWFVYKKTGNIQKSINIAKKILDLEVNNHCENYNHEHVANSNSNLGVAYALNGQYEEAVKYTSHALEIWEKFHDTNPNHPDIARGHINLGLRYFSQGKYKETELHYSKAVHKMISAPDNYTRDYMVNIHINFGQLFFQTFRYDKAILSYNEAEKVQKEFAPESINHPILAIIYSALGNVNYRKGNYEQALKYQYASLAILQVLYRTVPDNPSIAHCLVELGSILLAKLNYNEAINYYNEGLKILKEVCDLNHPDIGICYNNLGIAYRKTKQYDKALAIHQESFDNLTKVHVNHKYHPELAKCHNNLGIDYRMQGNYTKAIQHYKESLKIIDDIVDVERATAYTGLGNISLHQAKIDEAIKYFENALTDICQIFNDHKHPSVLGMRGNLAKAHYDNPILINISKQKIYNESENIQLAIQYQLILTEIDYDENKGYNYHNLACLYASSGNIKDATLAFSYALENCNTSALHAEYAQFLILHRENTFVSHKSKEISYHLYQAINFNDNSKLIYGQMEKESPCQILQEILQDQSSTIEVNPKILAYYLLHTNPEYVTNKDEYKQFADFFEQYCYTDSDNEVSVKLFSSAVLKDISLPNAWETSELLGESPI